MEEPRVKKAASPEYVSPPPADNASVTPGKTPPPSKANVASKSSKPIRRTLSKRPPRKRSDLKIPPILLEGDHAPALPVGGPGARYALAPQPVRSGEPYDPGELPEAYGTGRIFLAARDPHWLYASWDLSIQQQRSLNAQSREGHLILRVFAHGETRPAVPEVEVHPESKNWFINVGRPETRFHAEIGFYDRNSVWRTVSTSQSTFTPPAAASSDLQAEFATIPAEVTFQQVVEMVQEFVTDSKPLLEAVADAQSQAGMLESTGAHPASASGSDRLVVSRGIDTPDPKGKPSARKPKVEIKPAGEWTPAQVEALARLIHIDGFRRVWMGSMEITELVRRQLQEEISSIAAAEAKGLPTGKGAQPAPSGLNISSPFGGELRRARKFWFKVNAELIIYGATESDAKVSIAGRPIKLRPDGTFSFRFSLPDGRFLLPAVATSNDGAERREARLEFSRATEFQGHVEAHAQDSALRPPRPEHLH